jgi:prepilin-type N-terminal cleavage/methylation domain-containing protein
MQTLGQKTKGFTLIEMLVAVTIFIIVMLVAVGTLVSILGANQRAQNEKLVLDNMSQALETMSRFIRDGSVYHCGPGGSVGNAQTCSNGASFFALEGHGGSPTTESDQIVFRLNNGVIEESTDGGSTYVPMTASAVTITSLTFTTISYGAAIEEPKILITIEGESGNDTSKTAANYRLQTLVSQRLTIVSTGGTTAVSAGEGYSNSAQCVDASGNAFATQVGRYFATFEATNPTPAHLCSNGCSTELGQSATYTLATQIPPGIYDITLVGYDAHDQNPNCPATLPDTGPNEQFRIKIGSYTTASTDDITDDCSHTVDVKVASIGASFSSKISQITVQHSFPGSGTSNAVVPVCAVFDQSIGHGSGYPVNMQEF